MLGTIKGRQITKNRDGDIDKVMLQIEFLPDDVRIVELMTGTGEDFNPAIDARVFVIDETDSYKLAIASTDDLTPECDPGEKEFYSTDDPVTTKKAKLKLNKDSEVVLNDGIDYAVAYEDLKSAFDELKTDLNNLITAYNTHIHITTATVAATAVPGVISPTVSTGTPSTADMSGAKVDKVRL